jgi:hypothetical protein
MSSLDQIVEVNISQQTQAVPQASFSIPLIVGPTMPTSGTINAYTSPQGMLANGYTTSSPEYVYALELFEQPLTPTIFYVGYRAPAVEQVDTITVVTATSGHLYEGMIEGETWSYTASGGDTQSTIATAIASAINALANPTWNAVAVGAAVTITSTVPGLAFTDTQITPDAKYTIASVTPNYGIQDDINGYLAQSNGNAWYGMCACDFTDSDIEQCAALIESLKKIFIAVSSTSAIATNSVTDVGSILKGKSYKRTALIYTPEAVEGKDAAWLGGQLPQVPGSNNWAFKTLFGCTPDSLSANQQVILIGDPVAQVPGKNVNIYQTVGGVNVTQMGTMAGGQFIDLTVGIDWLQSTIQTNIYEQLVESPKIPYTDSGTAVLISAVKAAIDLGVTNGLIDGASPISITAPLVLSVPQNQRANRVAPTISFSCRLAGAFNAVVVNGTVTV